MTGFYMFRLMGKTFYGESHVDPHVEPNIHESPRSMTVPLILLAIPSIFLGIAIGLPPGVGLINQWLEPVFAGADADARHPASSRSSSPASTAALIIVGAGAGALGVALGIWFFGFFRAPREARQRRALDQPAAARSTARRSPSGGSTT